MGNQWRLLGEYKLIGSKIKISSLKSMYPKCARTKANTFIILRQKLTSPLCYFTCDDLKLLCGYSVISFKLLSVATPWLLCGFSEALHGCYLTVPWLLHGCKQTFHISNTYHFNNTPLDSLGTN